VAAKDDYLLDMLTDLGFVSPEQIASAREEAGASGVGVVDFLVANNHIRPGDVAQAKAAHFGAEVVQLQTMTIPDDVIALINRNNARRYRAIPVATHEHAVTVAITDPSELDILDGLQHTLGKEVQPVVASEDDIEWALNRYYGGSSTQPRNTAVDKMIQDITQGEVDVGGPQLAMDAEDGATVESDAPLIKLVNKIIIDAFAMRASDIHLEPLEKRFRIRYRIDGMLHEIPAPPKKLQASIIARL
jgi:general secretion pathway protein E/type IV pilus assembly protein PilB